ncbi:hypothetical protein [Promicromonospora sp. NPDC019610]|uniref:hypothetical protein n=1 Tax=Promicromonospora sp. NPDC019610 TaxID=3364405 RepID=UPI0037AACD85
MTLNPKTHVPSTPATAPRRRGTWSSVVRGVTAAGGALAVALLATACTQASAAVPDEPSAVPSVAADTEPAEAAPAPAPADEGEPSPVPAAPSESGPSDEGGPTPAPAAPAAPAETEPTDEGEPRPVPTVPGEPEQGLVVTG